MATTSIQLIRHGHTASNGGGPGAVMSGWTDLPLSSHGRWQVRRLRDRLRREPRFTAIYTSPLERALDTARPLAASDLGELHEWEGLREIGCGEVDGLPIEAVKERFQAQWAANLRQDDDDFRWPGGESYRELRERALASVRSIVARHAGGRVAVVTHAGVISQVVGYAAGVPPARWACFRPENTAITELAFSGDAIEVVRFDDHVHLAIIEDRRPLAG